jgi:hypothetical protein
MARIIRSTLVSFHTGNNSRPLPHGLQVRVVFQYLLYAGCKKKVNATLDGNAKKLQEFRAVRRCERQMQEAFSNRQSLARLGGHQNRKHDKRPEWFVLWRG